MGSRDTTNLKKLDAIPGKDRYKWKIRFKYTDPKWKSGNGHSRVLQRHYDGTLSEAQSERDHLRLYLKHGLDPDDYPRPHEAPDPVSGDAPEKSRKKRDDDQTFEEMHDLYKKHRATQDLSPRTLKTENAALRDHIIPAIGSWVVQRCSLRDFQDLRLDWHDQYVATDRYSSASVNKWIRILKIYVGWCSRRLGVAHSARDLKRLPKPKKRKGRAMSRDEVEALLVEVKTQYPHYYGIVYVLAYTGQRFSTISALKWSDIDTQNGLIPRRGTKHQHL